MSLQPCVDPFGFHTNGSSSTNARVMQLTTLAGGVNRVAADTGILCALGNGQPLLHSPSRAGPLANEPEVLWGVVTRSSASTVLAGARLNRADEGMLPTSGRESMGSHGVGDDSGIAF